MLYGFFYIYNCQRRDFIISSSKCQIYFSIPDISLKITPYNQINLSSLILLGYDIKYISSGV